MPQVNSFATLILQVGADIGAQVAIAVLIGYAWEYERRLIWWNVDEHPVATDLLLLVTGLAAGALGVLVWPSGYIDRQPFLQQLAIVSPVAAGFMMHRAGTALRARGHEPPDLLAVHAVTIFVLGVSLVRTAMLSGVAL
jgi:hypothetical protein